MSGITQGVKEFLKGSHKADSTEVSYSSSFISSLRLTNIQVCSEVAPEVTQEHVRQQEHVETAEAVDREKHIHHHQVRHAAAFDK
jgi:hypothetical protein